MSEAAVVKIFCLCICTQSVDDMELCQGSPLWSENNTSVCALATEKRQPNGKLPLGLFKLMENRQNFFKVYFKPKGRSELLILLFRLKKKCFWRTNILFWENWREPFLSWAVLHSDEWTVWGYKTSKKQKKKVLKKSEYTCCEEI